MNISPVSEVTHETAATPLTNEQIDDLYYYICQHGKESDNDNRFHLAIAHTQEETAFWVDVPDFYSVFISADRWPVAAAAPMDNLFYLMGCGSNSSTMTNE